MEEALISRLRANAGVIAAAGSHTPQGGSARPAVDLHERKSDARTAFPAAVVTRITTGRQYDQDGPGGLEIARMRFECFGLSAGSAIDLKRAIIAALEPAEAVGAVRFHRGKVKFERDFPPEDVADLRIFRTIIDVEIPATI